MTSNLSDHDAREIVVDFLRRHPDQKHMAHEIKKITGVNKAKIRELVTGDPEVLVEDLGEDGYRYQYQPPTA